MAAVWFGNDDYSPMDKVTGGTLPAMTWHDIMDYAHRGIALKPVFGLGSPLLTAALPAEPTQPAGANRNVLSSRTASAIGSIAALVADTAQGSTASKAEAVPQREAAQPTELASRARAPAR